ncbi:F-box/FBD/LRR-repeat protein At1g13570 [Impatiens glandulifera]|uniref:F-box/FBD/LRR-repeat protein At1g13570 n=1 Tax=Impatiens glandulifera TaxID=253017 RepID=UPI001FB15553|nr:F-box/FBD/LRR-repeat protein At1g13570 [Impatiens glandulifera]XP_047341292.1 F-box/FBD/LRR-repeat protein At1g13570 [Impatiens glandulifera]
MDSEADFISDLPQNIIETILTKLPIEDAVRSSLLSSTWRYRWANLTDIVIDDACAGLSTEKGLIEEKVVKFITHFLFLHNGPIHKFSLSSMYLQNSPDVDQWLLFLSRKGIKELVLELGEGEWFRAPSCLFACQKLTRLELIRCELDPPPNFRGFSCLKYLNLQQVLISPEMVESLISNCPLLENLTLSYFDSLALTVRAPNLKHLCLEGEFKDIWLKDTPRLVSISVAMYMTDDIAERFEQSSSCNFDKVLGGVPCLESLIGHIYFTQYLSLGNNMKRIQIYHHLKIIELYQVRFEDMKEILVVLQLIMNAPNLQELKISGSSNTTMATQAPDLDFWKNESLDCTFGQLHTVRMSDMSGVPHEMQFIKFLLGNSPVLEIMSIAPSTYVTDGRMHMLVDLLRFKRASALAEIIYNRD